MNTGFSFEIKKENRLVSPFGSANRLKMPALPEYNKAHLIIPEKDSKDQRWKIVYYVFDAQKGKKVRRADTSINKINDLEKRKLEAKAKIKIINKLLQDGYYYDPEEEERKKLIEKKDYLSVSAAFDIAVKSKTKFRKSTIKSYTDTWKKFQQWLKEHKLSSIQIEQLNKKHIEFFLDYLMIELKLAPRSRNNYLGAIKTLLNYLVEQELIIKNPAVGILSMNQGTGKNLAFNNDQQKLLMDFMRNNKPKWLLPCQMMYYTLIRTNELALLKVKNIGLYDKDKLYIPKDQSKNGHERHVVIPPQLQIVLEKMKLHEQDPEFYIFSRDYKPGPNQFPSKYIGTRYREQVLNPLNFSSDYTFYSWKHTGVTSCFFAGMPKGAIMQQTGHRTAASFETYIKSMGLFKNDELKLHYPTLPG